jgi:hypothetical protein
MAVKSCLDCSGYPISPSSSGNDLVVTRGDEGGLEFSVTAVKCVLGGASSGGEASLVPFTSGSSLGRSNMDGRARLGNAFVGLSGSCIGSEVDLGSMDSGSSISGRGGRGLRAPGEVRYVISCRHLFISTCF